MRDFRLTGLSDEEAEKKPSSVGAEELIDGATSEVSARQSCSRSTNGTLTSVPILHL
jgi:hypothetical protein